jgi:hypothetical protein
VDVLFRYASTHKANSINIGHLCQLEATLGVASEADLLLQGSISNLESSSDLARAVNDGSRLTAQWQLLLCLLLCCDAAAAHLMQVVAAADLLPTPGPVVILSTHRLLFAAAAVFRYIPIGAHIAPSPL